MTITPENLKILLVEDERIAQIVNTMLLKEMGYTPDLAENGQQALDMAQQQDYNLILMDIGLPDTNGIEVTIKIRDWEKGKARRTPIVALTAYALQEVEKKCLSAGMDKVITKPTNIDTLRQIITQFAIQTAKKDISELDTVSL